MPSSPAALGPASPATVLPRASLRLPRPMPPLPPASSPACAAPLWAARSSPPSCACCSPASLRCWAWRSHPTTTLPGSTPCASCSSGPSSPRSWSACSSCSSVMAQLRPSWPLPSLSWALPSSSSSRLNPCPSSRATFRPFPPPPRSPATATPSPSRCSACCPWALPPSPCCYASTPAWWRRTVRRVPPTPSACCSPTCS